MYPSVYDSLDVSFIIQDTLLPGVVAKHFPKPLPTSDGSLVFANTDIVRYDGFAHLFRDVLVSLSVAMPCWGWPCWGCGVCVVTVALASMMALTSRAGVVSSVSLWRCTTVCAARSWVSFSGRSHGKRNVDGLHRGFRGVRAAAQWS